MIAAGTTISTVLSRPSPDLLKSEQINNFPRGCFVVERETPVLPIVRDCALSETNEDILYSYGLVRPLKYLRTSWRESGINSTPHLLQEHTAPDLLIVSLVIERCKQRYKHHAIKRRVYCNAALVLLVLPVERTKDAGSS